MKTICLAAAALALAAGLSGGSTAALAGDYGYHDVEETTVVTRRTVVDRPVMESERILREEVLERPLVPPHRRVVREFVEERPLIRVPRPVAREVVVERRVYDGPPAYGPREAGFVEDGPDFDPDE